MKQEIEILLSEIDDLLARFEDFTHGKDGEEITKMRGKIQSFLHQSEGISDEEIVKKGIEHLNRLSEPDKEEDKWIEVRNAEWILRDAIKEMRSILSSQVKVGEIESAEEIFDKFFKESLFTTNGKPQILKMIKYALCSSPKEECDGLILGKYIFCKEEPEPNDLVYSLITQTVVTFTDSRFFSESTYFKVKPINKD